MSLFKAGQILKLPGLLSVMFVYQGKLKHPWSDHEAKETAFRTPFSNGSIALGKDKHANKCWHLVSVRGHHIELSNLQHLPGSHIPCGRLLGVYHLVWSWALKIDRDKKRSNVDRPKPFCLLCPIWGPKMECRGFTKQSRWQRMWNQYLSVLAYKRCSHCLSVWSLSSIFAYSSKL